MPFVTAAPKGQSNGQVIREFVDSVGTQSVIYAYPTVQELLTVKNTGQQPVTVTVSGENQTISSGGTWNKAAEFTSFTISSSSGVQSFEARADEKGSSIDSNAEKAITELPLINTPGLPANKNKYDGSAPKLVVQPVNHTTGIPSSAGATTDTTNTFAGNPTLKLTSTGANVFVNFDLGALTDLSGHEFVDLYLCMDNIAQLAVLQVEFSSYSNYLDSFRITSPTLFNDPNENGWGFHRIPVSTFVYQPAANPPATPTTWAGIRYVRVFVRSNAGTTINVNIGKIELAKAPAKGKILLFYDDGYDNQYTNGYIIAKNNGLKGSIAVITARVGGPPDPHFYVTWPQLHEMASNDWLVCSHTHNHINLSEVDETTARNDLSTSVTILKENGFTFGSRCLIAPYGGWNAAVDKIAREYFSICRTGTYSLGVFNSRHQTHPRKQLFASPLNTDSVATMKSWVDQVIANKQEMCIAWHKIKDTNPTSDQYTYLTADYAAVIQYIKSKVDEGVLDVVTWQDTMIQSNTVMPVSADGKRYLTVINGNISVVQI